LAHLTGEASYRDRAARTLERYGAGLGRIARVMPLMLTNVVTWLTPASQVVIVGLPDDDGRAALEQAAASAYAPANVYITIDAGDPNVALARELPWVAAMSPVHGRAAAYVCRDFTCQAPTTSAAELAKALTETSTPSRIILP